MDEMKKIEFEYAIKQRNFEIELFWKRSWFFGVLIIAMVSAFYITKSTKIVPPVLVAFILMTTTIIQSLMNRGSKYWQERWEYITMNRESALGIELTKLRETFVGSTKAEWEYIEASILSKDENIFTRATRISVSKLTILVWDILAICSMINWGNECFNIYSINPNWGYTMFLFLFHFFIIFYMCLFIHKGKILGNNNNLSSYKKMNEKYIKNNFSN